MLKPFASHFKSITEGQLLWMAVLYSIGNGLGRSIWGFLYDYFGFKRLYIIIITTGMIISGTISLAAHVPGLFFIFVVLSGWLLAGLFALMPSICSKIFTVKYASEVYGMIFLVALSISGMVAPIMSKVLKLSESPNTSPYLILFEFGAFMYMISLIVLIMMDEKEFDYSQAEDKQSEIV